MGRNVWEQENIERETRVDRKVYVGGWIKVMEGEDVYFSGDQIPIFVRELLLRHGLSGNVFGFLSLR